MKPIGLRPVFLISVALVAAGCGGGLAGTYQADARLVPGKVETGEKGNTLEEIRTRIAHENRTLTLKRKGRFVWDTGSATNEGTWRVEGTTLMLREDTFNGTPIGAALQKDRKWAVTENDNLISGNYSAYNIEEFYTRQ